MKQFFPIRNSWLSFLRGSEPWGSRYTSLRGSLSLDYKDTCSLTSNITSTSGLCTCHKPSHRVTSCHAINPVTVKLIMFSICWQRVRGGHFKAVGKVLNWTALLWMVLLISWCIYSKWQYLIQKLNSINQGFILGLLYWIIWDCTW